MIERNHPDLSISQQCALLSIPRASLYSAPQGETEQNLALMRLIDVQFLETPFFGVRQVTWHLRNDGQFNKNNRPAGPIGDVAREFILDHFPIEAGTKLMGSVV